MNFPNVGDELVRVSSILDRLGEKEPDLADELRDAVVDLYGNSVRQVTDQYESLKKDMAEQLDHHAGVILAGITECFKRDMELERERGRVYTAALQGSMN